MSETNLNPKVGLLKIINDTPTFKLPTIPEVASRFKELYSIIHGGDKKTEAFYEAEKFHFMKMIQDNKKLGECTKMSLYGCFMDVAVNGLSFDPTFKHLYLVPYSVNIGTQGQQVWEKRAQLQIAGSGELILRQKHGQIKYADNPILVYEGDDFSFGTKGIGSYVEHTVKLPRKKDAAIIAGYVKITRPDGSVDYKVITGEDMERFRKFSKDPNSKAWTDGIGGMWLSKCIKHAFKNYPKMRMGDAKLITQIEDINHEEVSTAYKSAESHDDVFDTTSQPVQNQNTHDDESFAKSNAVIPTVNVVDDDDKF